MANRALSPLRYPGAKRLLLPAIRDLLPEHVDLLVEPFAGGASVALALLDEGRADRVVLGDADPLVAAFWSVSTGRPGELIEAMRAETPSVERWDYWRQANPSDELGMAVKCLFLNRTSFSGVLHGEAGPLGGRAGRGEGIAGRWAAETVASRIRHVAELGGAGRITVVAGDWRETVDVGLRMAPDPLVYADPPYVSAGTRLYARSFTVGDHAALAAGLTTSTHRWVLSYDDHPTVRDLYGSVPGLGRYAVTHTYSATGRRRRAAHCAELLITSTPAPACGLETWGEAEMAA